MGSHLAGAPGGFSSVLALALTPPFYGHCFNNPKDVPFAALFALALSAIIDGSEGAPRLKWRSVLWTGLAIGLAAGVRVAGIVLFGLALVAWMGTLWLTATDEEERRRGRTLARMAVAWLVVVGLGWTVMIALWPWAQLDPFRNPGRALRAFSRFWETMIVFYDGRYLPSGEVSRFYLPTWFALTLPELYLVAGLMALRVSFDLFRARPLPRATRVRLFQAAGLAGAGGLPVAWAVAMHTPLYDGLRHFLFVMPILAVLAGISVVAYLRRHGRSVEGRVAGAALGALCLVTLIDMARLHPYQAVYFNRLVAGGLRRAVGRYETDYWCLSYKEGAEWLLREYAGADCPEKIRVGGHSILLQTAYYLRKTDEGRRLFSPVTLDDDPNYALATTRYGDHEHTPGRLVHTVDRQGATLLYVFEVRPPACGRRP
jgi:hypothetical protein